MRIEELLKQIEEIVRKLESPDTELEEAIKLFEQGMDLIKRCEKILNEAEARIEAIVKREGSYEKLDFDEATRLIKGNDEQ